MEGTRTSNDELVHKIVRSAKLEILKLTAFIDLYLPDIVWLLGHYARDLAPARKTGEAIALIPTNAILALLTELRITILRAWPALALVLEALCAH